jgi:DNA-binding MarR family transcriptional regulator/GNAT superfamily N-acetyltransferase
MPDAMVEQVRRFNRTVTQRVGALDDHFLARDRPLGEARVLWEIGANGSDIRTLRSRLDLDSGYLSRLLRSLEADGLVAVSAGGQDRRVRVARLTAKGREELRELDRRSDELAGSLLAPLTARQRERLVGAMREVERLLTAAMVEIVTVDPEHPDARQCLRSYFAELERRSGAPFDPLVGSTAEPDELRPPKGEMVVAYLRAEPVGCGALKHTAERTTDIKRMWLAESARGLGLGRRLLHEAIALYGSAGYEEVPAFNDEPFAHHWFARTLG